MKRANELFLGVDGGQSSTTAVIGNDEGKIIGWASAGPCNHVGASEAREKFLRVMGECLAQAARHAGIADDKPHFASACLGMSGGPSDKKPLLAELIDSESIEVTTDAAIALSGAVAGGAGVIVIAGTGSIGMGRNDAGEVARAGGWGYVFGDEGGAFDIVRQALRAMLREHEGWGPRTPLTPALLAACEADEANDLLHRFYTPVWPRNRVATLAPIVNRIAEEGDPVSLDILHASAHQLAMLAASITRQLWKDEEALSVSYIGGVFTSEIVRERFRTLVELRDGTRCMPPQHSPAVGALLQAYRSKGLRPVLANPSGLKT